MHTDLVLDALEQALYAPTRAQSYRVADVII